MHALFVLWHLFCVVVTVRHGDTLTQLANTHSTTWQSVYVDNRSVIHNPDLIYPNERLTICQHVLASQQTLMQVSISVPTCQASPFFPVGPIHLWEIPIGCYAGIYWGGHGDCFGWIRYLDHDRPLHQISEPQSGAFIHFAPGDQGASPAGHWAAIVAIRGRWALVSEENMYWRGGGYNKISYRYVLLDQTMVYYQ